MRRLVLISDGNDNCFGSFFVANTHKLLAYQKVADDAAPPRGREQEHLGGHLVERAAQREGQAGSLAYMPRCPTPAQGSCRGIFGQPALVAFYYERTDDDLAALPASCGMGGGSWEEAAG